MRAEYDVTEMVKQFVEGKCADRGKLVAEMREAVIHERACRLLLAQVGNEAVKNGLAPIESMGLSLMYGMVIGILLEKERAARSKRLIM